MLKKQTEKYYESAGKNRHLIPDVQKIFQYNNGIVLKKKKKRIVII